jgi:hypothetical protein
MEEVARAARNLAYRLPDDFSNILAYGEQGNADVVRLMVEAAENKIAQLQEYAAQLRLDLKMPAARVIAMQRATSS